MSGGRTRRSRQKNPATQRDTAELGAELPGDGAAPPASPAAGSTVTRDTLIANLEALISAGKDGPAVRFGLGKACLERPDPAAARSHLEHAVTLDPSYSAAWKLLGRACTEEGDTTAAADAYRRGIAASTAQGDRQAAKEMEVFLRRLERGPPSWPR